MALTGANLTDEVQAITGRTTSGEPLVDNTRVTRWLNEAQVKIVEKCVGLHSLSFKNTDSLDTSVQLKYAISDITVGDSSTAERVNRIWDVYYLDGNESRYLDFMQTDEFDEKYPDPTHDDHGKSRPEHWTRRGDYIEMFPLCLTAYCDKNLRFDGDFFPHELTTEDSTYSDISGGDEGLIMYAVAKAWAAIGQDAKAAVWEVKFKNWLEDFRDLNDNQHEWDGKMHGTELV